MKKQTYFLLSIMLFLLASCNVITVIPTPPSAVVNQANFIYLGEVVGEVKYSTSTTKREGALAVMYRNAKLKAGEAIINIDYTHRYNKISGMSHITAVGQKIRFINPTSSDAIITEQIITNSTEINEEIEEEIEEEIQAEFNEIVYNSDKERHLAMIDTILNQSEQNNIYSSFFYNKKHRYKKNLLVYKSILILYDIDKNKSLSVDEFYAFLCDYCDNSISDIDDFLNDPQKFKYNMSQLTLNCRIFIKDKKGRLKKEWSDCES